MVSTKLCMRCNERPRLPEYRFCSNECNNSYFSKCVVCRKNDKISSSSRYCGDECKEFGLCLLQGERSCAPACKLHEVGDCTGNEECFYKHYEPQDQPDSELLRNGHTTIAFMVGDALSGRITNYLIDMYSKDQSPEIGYTASGKPFKIQNTQEQPADKTHANTDFFGSEIELSHIVTEKALRWGITKARASSVIYMEIVRGELIDVLKVMTADENFSRFIQRMMFLDQVHASAQEAKDAIVQQLAKDARDCRVYGYPASSQNEIVEQAAAYSTAGEGTITLSPAKYTKTGFFMHRCLESSDSYYTGFFDLQPQGVTDEIVQKFRVLLRCKPKEFDKQASRAYYKLDEAFRRTDIVHWMTESVGDNVAEGETRTYSKAVALDIGASPGGWSYWLADRCATVVAVDPGALKAPIPSNVIHVQDRIENFLLPEMQANADFGGGLKFNLLVCDMNIPPTDCMEIVSTAKDLLAPGAALVVTLKNHRGGRKFMYENTEKAAEMFSAMCEPSTVRKFQLISGREQEYTMVGRTKA